MTRITRANNEVLDVLDEDGEVQGRASRSRVHDEMLWHRAVHVLLFDARGWLLLQKRAPTKRAYPDTWTSSASGHVPAGQAPAEAARREVAEELGFDVKDLVEVAAFRFEDAAPGEREHVHVFRGHLEPGHTLSPDTAEVAGLRRIAPDDLVTWMTGEPEAFATSFRAVMEAVDGPREARGTRPG